jgi:pyruvate/2-oxoglutarate dehydrogenase complex dihydrolipoamide acyltransferase (E2) component
LLIDIILEATETEADEFTVSYWKLDEGDAVAGGDELLVVESVDDKTAFSVAAKRSGRLAEIVAREDERVSRGAVLGRMEVA